MPKVKGFSIRAQIEDFAKSHPGSYTVKDIKDRFNTSYPNAKTALDDIVLNYSWAIVIKEGARSVYTFRYKVED